MQNGSDKLEKLPKWNLTDIYTGLDSDSFKNDMDEFNERLLNLQNVVEKKNPFDLEDLKKYVENLNMVKDLKENLDTYTYLIYSTDTYNRKAIEKINLLEEIAIPLKKIQVVFRNRLKNLKNTYGASYYELISNNQFLKLYRFFLDEELFLADRQMSEKEEELAGDLARAGSDAWERLQETISSQLKVIWNESTSETKTVTQLRAMAHNKDRSIRKKAYEKELQAWESMKVPLSFALNGVKGFSVILNRRRKFINTLERSIIQSRITKKTLDSLIKAMQNSLSHFRRYLKAKAKLLNLEKLSFYDIFAPVGKNTKKWSFKEAGSFIEDQFFRFSDDLGNFANKAFKNGWIDAEPRDGKVGGAYCATIPLKGESRILCNFDGSFNSVSTVAHELGHGYHHDVLKQTPNILRTYPMTLAETASIFCENIVFNGALEEFTGNEKLAALEVYLADSTQVIVDILSRFLFESKVMQLREKKEISAEEFNDLMLDAQKKTYGDALNQEELHPYMWAVKGHYYNADFAFYNFPYAFGLLFGVGLYSRFREEGKSFAKKYRELLSKTGMKSANELTMDAGFDIEKVDFWSSGLKVIEERIDQFIEEGEKHGKT